MTTYGVSEHIVVRPEEHGAILLDTRRGIYWEINAGALRVLELAREGRDPRSISAQIVSETGQDEVTVAHDVHTALAQFRRARVVRIVTR